MIRPLNISNNIHFGAKTIMGGAPSDKNEIPDNEKPSKTGYRKEDVKAAFLIGAAIGTMVAAGGTTAYKDSQTDRMLREIAAESVYGVDSMKVENLTDDSTPEIILFGKDGAATVYDFGSNKSFVKFDDDMIEIER